MFTFSRVHLHKFVQKFTFSRVRLYFHVRFFFSCAFKSILRVLVCAYGKKWFLFLVRVFIKNICFFSPVRLHQNGSFFSCASSSKCLLLLGCACIKMFLVSAYINFCVYLCMRKSKWFLSLDCANIKIFAYTCVHVLTSCVFIYLSPPTSK